MPTTKSEPVASVPSVPKRLYTIPEAAHYLARSVWGVRGLIDKGELPVIRADRRIHLDINDLDTFIDRHRVRETL